MSKPSYKLLPLAEGQKYCSRQIMTACGIKHTMKFYRLVDKYRIKYSFISVTANVKGKKRYFTKESAIEFIKLYKAEMEGKSIDEENLTSLKEEVNKYRETLYNILFRLGEAEYRISKLEDKQ